MVWELVSGLQAWLILLVLFIYILRIILNGLRWQGLLRVANIRIPVKDVEKMIFLGFFVSNFLPTTIGGDVVRLLSLFRYTDLRSRGFASVVLDRLVNVIAMLSVIPFSIWTFGPSLRNLFIKVSLLVSPVGLASMITGENWVARLYTKLRKFFSYWARIFQIWLKRPFSLLLAFIISWVSIFIYFVANWFLARGLGMDIELFQVMGITAITYLITLLPISINGYGVREIAITTLYIQMGATREQATSLAVVSRFLMLIATLPGAFWIAPLLSGDLDKNEVDVQYEAFGSSEIKPRK
jgi:uncharacterized protein (TIRG00374 family)